jgi:hypothetical protein
VHSFKLQTEQEMLESICECLVSGGEFLVARFCYCENNAERIVRRVAKPGDVDYLEQPTVAIWLSQVNIRPLQSPALGADLVDLHPWRDLPGSACRHGWGPQGTLGEHRV